MEETGKDDGKDGQTMEKMDKRWNRRTNNGKDGQRMKKTAEFEKDGQRMEKTDKG